MELANAKVERKTIFGAMAFGTGWLVVRPPTMWYTTARVPFMTGSVDK